MVLDELATLLQAAGIGTIPETIIQYKLPLDGPIVRDASPQVALIEIPGMEAQRTHDGNMYEQPMVNIVTRGAPYGDQAARQKAQDAWEVLDGVSNQVLSGVYYLWIFTLRSPHWLRTDDLARPWFVFDIRCARVLP